MEQAKLGKDETIYLGRTEQVLGFYAVHMAHSLLDLCVILPNITSLSKISFDLLFPFHVNLSCFLLNLVFQKRTALDQALHL